MSCTRILSTAVACTVLGLSGCGGGGSVTPPPTFMTQILSDPAFDGDIELTPSNQATVTQGMGPNVQSVLSGIDAQGNEFRAFLDFPLGGSTGVPANAGIDSAFLEIYVDDLLLGPQTQTLPVLVELVAFQPPTLIPSDFDRTTQPPLAAVRISPPINAADVGHRVSIDVTSLMVQAQRQGLPDFQVRVMEDLGPAIQALMVIDNTTGADRSKRAPLLTVTYF